MEGADIKEFQPMSCKVQTFALQPQKPDIFTYQMKP